MTIKAPSSTLQTNPIHTTTPQKTQKSNTIFDLWMCGGSIKSKEKYTFILFIIREREDKRDLSVFFFMKNDFTSSSFFCYEFYTNFCFFFIYSAFIKREMKKCKNLFKHIEKLKEFSCVFQLVSKIIYIFHIYVS